MPRDTHPRLQGGGDLGRISAASRPHLGRISAASRRRGGEPAAVSPHHLVHDHHARVRRRLGADILEEAGALLGGGPRAEGLRDREDLTRGSVELSHGSRAGGATARDWRARRCRPSLAALPSGEGVWGGGRGSGVEGGGVRRAGGWGGERGGRAAPMTRIAYPLRRWRKAARSAAAVFVSSPPMVCSTSTPAVEELRCRWVGGRESCGGDGSCFAVCDELVGGDLLRVLPLLD